MTTPTLEGTPMLYPTTPEVLRRRRLIVAGVATALLLIAFVTYAVLVHRAHSRTSAVPNPPAAVPAPGGPTSVANVATELPKLPPTSDPEAFGRVVAGALFEWDTATMITRADHIEQLVKVGDPTGESTAGLLSDIGGYLPTDEAWRDLAQYETRQWLTIETVSTPSKWAEAEAQAGDALLPGTTALTIHGIRHRAGVWDGDPVSSQYDVAFTVFIVCGPSYPECHLLRLSVLDKPLG
ncbi:MAG: hypothetical protein ACJ716_01175 [Marmoricola sp.]